jgi:hypothetical protein
MFHRSSGISLLETLLAGAIFAGVVISGVTLSSRVTDNAVRGGSNRTLSSDARDALISIRDDIQIASVTGSLVPNSNPALLRSDPNRGSSLVLALTSVPTPDEEITYFVDAGVLYRVDVSGVRDVARNVVGLDAVVEERHYQNPSVPSAKLVHVTLTLEHGGVVRGHSSTARLRGD